MDNVGFVDVPFPSIEYRWKSLLESSRWAAMVGYKGDSFGSPVSPGTWAMLDGYPPRKRASLGEETVV